jgi:S-formylglutathione hydrolase FrmB
MYRVALPDRLEEGRRYRVLYVLPVEAGLNRKYGDPLEVFRTMNVHNRHGLILVVPQFETDPWYGNHAMDPRRQYEAAMVKEIVSDVDRLYPTVACAEGRILVGFSKSGWGAFTLILRNPDVFGYAASWDAPLMMTEKHFGSWRTDETFGTPQNMAAYVPTRLFQQSSAEFQKKTRLVLAGKNLFGSACDPRFPYEGPSQTEAAHASMEKHGIRHVYDAGVIAPHQWHGGWIAPVLAMVLELAGEQR